MMIAMSGYYFIEESFLNEDDISKTMVEKVVVQDIVAHILNPKPHIKITGTIDFDKQFV
jgi:hypothetical protein